MKKSLLLIVLLAGTMCPIFAQSQFGFNTDTPKASAVMDIESSDKGVLLPRMNTTQRTAIASPDSGLVVYDSILHQFMFHNGTAWKSFSTNIDTANSPLAIVSDSLKFVVNQGNGSPPTSNHLMTYDGNNWIAKSLDDIAALTSDSRDNMQPFQTLNYYIALAGTFPSTTAPYLGQIMVAAFDNADPDGSGGWAKCDGQILAISSNPALFSLLGTTYGGDGAITFGLPDLRGRVALHKGDGPTTSNRNWGETGGSETVTDQHR